MKSSIKEKASVIFLLLVGVTLVTVGFGVLAMAAFLGAWGYAFGEFAILSLFPIAMGLFSGWTALSVVRKARR